MMPEFKVEQITDHADTVGPCWIFPETAVSGESDLEGDFHFGNSREKQSGEFPYAS